MLTKLVSTKGSNTRFDAASAQRDKEEPHHGHRTAWEEGHVDEKKVLPSRSKQLNMSIISRNSHMKGHVVWCPVSVYVSDVMDCTDGHRNLADRIDNGQVDDGPVRGRGNEIVLVT